VKKISFKFGFEGALPKEFLLKMTMNRCIFQLILLYVMMSVPCKGDILFPKDTSVDFVFPPKKMRSSSMGVPDGHLRPLGK